MASAGARAYNGGLGPEPPAGSRGRAPGGASGGRSPLKSKVFQLSDVQWKWQNCHIMLILQCQQQWRGERYDGTNSRTGPLQPN